MEIVACELYRPIVDWIRRSSRIKSYFISEAVDSIVKKTLAVPFMVLFDKIYMFVGEKKLVYNKTYV